MPVLALVVEFHYGNDCSRQALMDSLGMHLFARAGLYESAGPGVDLNGVFLEGRVSGMI